MKSWLDNLPRGVYIRLCQCESLKSDLPELVNARWAAREDESKDYALDYILELLEANGQEDLTDLSQSELNEILGFGW